jgi:predicted acylesterase/phospholipase RssA
MLRIFRNSDLSAEVVLASACLPQLFQAVEIDGNTSYWDGGYRALSEEPTDHRFRRMCSTGSAT